MRRGLLPGELSSEGLPWSWCLGSFPGWSLLGAISRVISPGAFSPAAVLRNLLHRGHSSQAFTSEHALWGASPVGLSSEEPSRVSPIWRASLGVAPRSLPLRSPLFEYSPRCLFMRALPLEGVLRNLHLGSPSIGCFPWRLLLGGSTSGSIPLKSIQGWLLGASLGCYFSGPFFRSFLFGASPLQRFLGTSFWVSLLECTPWRPLRRDHQGLHSMESYTWHGSSEPFHEGHSMGIFLGKNGSLNRGVWEELGWHCQAPRCLPGCL